MSSLTQTTQIIRKFAPPVLVAIIIASLVGLITLRLIKNPQEEPAQVATFPPPEIAQNPNQKAPGQIILGDLESPNIPDILPVFIARKLTLTDQWINNLASTFGVTASPSFVEENTLDGKQYNWDQNDKKLTINDSSIQFENINIQNTQVTLTEEDLKAKVQLFINNIQIIDKDLVLNSSKTKYLKTSNGRVTSAASFNDSQLVEYSYDKLLSQIPIIFNSPDSNYVKVRITKTGDIQYLSARFFDSFSEEQSVKIKKFTIATNEIINKQGKMVYASLLDQNGQANELFRTQPQKIQSLTIKKGAVGYYFPADVKEPLQPIFVFDGSFQEGNQVGKVLIYLPAAEN